jgi:hypothetical protein
MSWITAQYITLSCWHAYQPPASPTLSSIIAAAAAAAAHLACLAFIAPIHAGARLVVVLLLLHSAVAAAQPWRGHPIGWDQAAVVEPRVRTVLLHRWVGLHQHRYLLLKRRTHDAALEGG